MRKYIFISIALFTVATTFAQNAHPVKWSIATVKKAKIGDTIQVEFAGKINNDWYVYASDSDSTEYVDPASLFLEANSSFELVSKLKSFNATNYYDRALKTNTKVFRENILMKQTLIVRKKPFILTGILKYTVVRQDINSGTVSPKTRRFEINIE